MGLKVGTPKKDTLLGDPDVRNDIFGDTDGTLTGNGKAGKGGNDKITGGENSHINLLVGDAEQMTGGARGGNDALTGGADSDSNVLSGDAYLVMSGGAQGGNDILTGGADSTLSELYGDAVSMSDGAQGGNDILTGGVGENSENLLIGDASQGMSGAEGGDDRLISASNTPDEMYGDFINSDGTATGGADTFVLSPDSGNDIIYDFRQDEDTIELNGFASGTEFADLDIETVQVDGIGPLDSVIHFDDDNSVTVYGIAQLAATDFTFMDLVV
jgi:hypothetical protein